MKKIKLFLLSLSFLFIPNVFSMFARTIMNRSIAQNKSFHTTTSTLKTMDWEERIEIEKRLHEKTLLKDPEFLQKVNTEYSAARNLLLKKIIAQNEAIIKQNHIMFLHHLNDRVGTHYTARESEIQKTQTALRKLYEEYNIDIAHSKDNE